MHKDLDGYHAYYAYKGFTNPYNHLNVLVQLASALYWKKHFGQIHLVCNLAHFETLEVYGVDKVYDSIDLDTLSDMCTLDKRYWSMSKMYLASKLSETKQRYAIIDTDLWLRGIPNYFDLTKDFIGLHYESFVLGDKDCAYPEPKEFIGEDRASMLDWSILPINTAIMYLNNPKLVQDWSKFYKWVVERNRDNPHPKTKQAVETIFIEQRLLPTLATYMGYNVGTLIPSTFHTNLIQSDGTILPDNWEPTFASSSEMQDCLAKIRHVWGLKNQFKDDHVRKGLVAMVVRDLEQDGVDLSNFKLLIKDNVVNG